MSTGGDVDVESGGLGLLATGDGQLITEAGKVTNNSSATAHYVFVGFGASVSDESAKAVQQPTPQRFFDSGDTTTSNPSNPSNTDTSSVPTTRQSTDSTDTSVTPAAGQTTINITAEAEIYLVVVADGVTCSMVPFARRAVWRDRRHKFHGVHLERGQYPVHQRLWQRFKWGMRKVEATYT